MSVYFSDTLSSQINMQIEQANIPGRIFLENIEDKKRLQIYIWTQHVTC